MIILPGIDKSVMEVPIRAARRKIRIIVVDDNPIFLEGISMFLSRNDQYEVIGTFNSGPDFIEVMENYHPDIILIDIEMPWLNGLETAYRIKAFNSDLKFIAVTMYHDQIYTKKLMDNGFRGFINKNEIIEKLGGIIEKVMAGEIAFG
jgi:DNA-binding NarL/FixJ family response regulator